MPNLLTSAAYNMPLSGQPFNGLLVLRQWNRFIYGECLIFRLDNGLITEAYNYPGGPTTNLVALTLPVNVPATATGEAYAIGFFAGNTADLIANLPVSGYCGRVSTLITMPDQAEIEVSALEASIFRASPTVTQLQAQIDALNLQLVIDAAAAAADCDNQTAALQATHDAELTAAAANLAMCQAQVATLEAQVAALTPPDEATQAAAVQTSVNSALVGAASANESVSVSSSGGGGTAVVVAGIEQSRCFTRGQFVPRRSVIKKPRPASCDRRTEPVITADETRAKVDTLMVTASRQSEAAGGDLLAGLGLNCSD